MIIYKNKVFKKVISHKEIKNKILDISEKLNNHYVNDNLVIICVLNGSVVVLNELLKSLNISNELDYIELSSYKVGTETTGKIDIVKDISVNIENKRILII